MIYWLVSNLMAIGQQYLTNRLIGRAACRVGGACRQRGASGRGNVKPPETGA